MKRRAWDSNPQPVTRHLISSEAASHSLTLQRFWYHFRRPEVISTPKARSRGSTLCSILQTAEIDLLLGLFERISTSDELNKFGVRLEFSQLSRELLHGLDVMHRCQGTPQHGHCM